MEKLCGEDIVVRVPGYRNGKDQATEAPRKKSRQHETQIDLSDSGKQERMHLQLIKAHFCLLSTLN